MARIELLQDELINKIAAGEVVERPASVIKELVENSIDAGASWVKISLREGGTSEILVADNGSGVHPEDAPLVLRRHATSKIASLDDLFCVDTMGFRGEALASIAAVSRFSLKSRRQGSDSGFRLEVEPEKPEPEVLPWNGPVGTTIRVGDLFTNVPVRKKFLKKPSVEYGHCLELIQALALNYPNVGFELEHNERSCFRAEPVACLDDDFLKGETAIRQRAGAVLGAETAKKLVYCQEAGELAQVEMLLSPPGLEKATGKQLFIFVNGRWVKDKTIRYGILRGYHSHLLKGRFPVAVLHLGIDPGLVDVNVHPAKTELRFQYSADIQKFLAMTIRSALRQGAWAEPPSNQVTAKNIVEGSQETPEQSHSPTITRPAQTVTQPTMTAKTTTTPPPRSFNSASPHLTSFKPAATTQTASPSLPPLDFDLEPLDIPKATELKITRQSFTGTQSQQPSPQPAGLFHDQTPLLDDKNQALDWQEAHYCGSFAECYLLFEYKKQLVVVDQHAFHERILYERFLSSYADLGMSQGLLVPEVVSLTPIQVQKLLDQKTQLQKLGFEIEPSCESAVEIKGVPSLLHRCDLDKLMSEVAEALVIDESTIQETQTAHHLLSTLACHSAVRAGSALSETQVKDLMAMANGVDFYHNCPHGRRVLRYFSYAEVGRWFDRA